MLRKDKTRKSPLEELALVRDLVGMEGTHVTSQSFKGDKKLDPRE